MERNKKLLSSPPVRLEKDQMASEPDILENVKTVNKNNGFEHVPRNCESFNSSSWRKICFKHVTSSPYKRNMGI